MYKNIKYVSVVNCTLIAETREELGRYEDATKHNNRFEGKTEDDSINSNCVNKLNALPI